MNHLPQRTWPSYFGLSQKDLASVIIVIGIITIAIFVLIADPSKPAFDLNWYQKYFMPALSLAVLSALVFGCAYAYLLLQRTTFLFVGLCWLANLVYTICSMLESNEKQKFITFVVALIADIPLFLSSFSDEQRRWWLPLLPSSVIAFSIVFYTPEDLVASSSVASGRLLILYLVGPLASSGILVWTSYALYFRGVLDRSIRYLGYYSLAFLVLALLQLPHTFNSFCTFWPSLFDCRHSVMILSVTKTGAVLTKLGILVIIFLIIKNELRGMYRKQESAEKQLKIKGEFEELGFFAASIEHELRNPLEVIGGEIEYVKGQTQSQERLKPHFFNLERQLNRMSVAANIINVLRARREDIIHNIKPLEVISLANQAIKYVKEEFSQQIDGILFTAKELTQQLFIEGDSSLLEQCLVNVLKNSVESLNRSKKGGEVVVEILSSDKDTIFIRVKDKGDGFIVDDISQLVDPSYTKKRVSNQRSNRGLGLFVCDKIVGLHNGQIAFANQEKGGAIVTLTFPRYVTRKMQKAIVANVSEETFLNVPLSRE